MLGFDSCYRNDYEDMQIVAISVSEGRIILTRDRPVLLHGKVARGYWVRATDQVDFRLLEESEIPSQVEYATKEIIGKACRCARSCGRWVGCSRDVGIADKAHPPAEEDKDRRRWRCRHIENVCQMFVRKCTKRPERA